MPYRDLFFSTPFDLVSSLPLFVAAKVTTGCHGSDGSVPLHHDLWRLGQESLPSLQGFMFPFPLVSLIKLDSGVYFPSRSAICAAFRAVGH